ncbi:MAG: DUF2442 domain-containing protein [Gammaproteobacteria bacterium]|nr:DUF2442 domain-containing protein [Gammaproteobacteria bacterium]
MTPNVHTVEPKTNYVLRVEFENGEVCDFDVTPYLDKGIFKELKNKRYFNQVKVIPYGVEWPHQQDLSADTLYITGSKRKKVRAHIGRNTQKTLLRPMRAISFRK